MNLILPFGPALALLLTSNLPAPTPPTLTPATTYLTPQPAARGPWQRLFDKKTLIGWHTFQKPGQPIPANWEVADGAIHYTGTRGGGDIVTDNAYGNFELELEWKIAVGGNSGIMYHVSEDTIYKATYETGPEMQVLDDARHPDANAGREGSHKAGSLYDMLPPNDLAAVKPAGQWNKVRLRVLNGQAEHFMNGKEIVAYPTSGPSWDAMVAKSKFKNWAGFGKFTTGKIALQDHGDQVWYRNIRIREL